MTEPLTPDERATLRQSEHDCNCPVCDDLIERYEATVALLAARDAAAATEKERALEAMNDEWAGVYAKETAKLNGWVSQCSDAMAALAAQRDAARALLIQYRAQHDCCAVDPDDELPRCPCGTCDAAVAWLARLPS